MKLDDRLDFPLATYGSGIITKRGMAVGSIYFIDLAEDIVRRLNLEWHTRTSLVSSQVYGFPLVSNSNLPPNVTVMDMAPDCAVALVERPDGSVGIGSLSQALAGRLL